MNVEYRFNSDLNGVITYRWLEKELSSFDDSSVYFVIEGFYDRWNSEKEEQSPNLENILNFMDSKSFIFVSMFPMGNPNCKEMVFKKEIKTIL